MYAFIRGKIALIGEQHLALDVSGVGYKISVTQRFLQQAKLGEEVVLYTHLIVREDDLSLYGFAAEQEKNMFERLIGISGVGPKAGMAILSSMTPVSYTHLIEDSLPCLARAICSSIIASRGLRKCLGAMSKCLGEGVVSPMEILRKNSAASLPIS